MWQQYIQLTRPANYTLPFIQILAGYVIAGGSVWSFSTDLSLLIGVTFLVHAGFTLLNDIADRDVDIANHVDTLVTRGTRQQLRYLTLSACSMVGVALIISLLLPDRVQLLLLLTCLMSYAYNHKPLQFSHKPLSSIAGLVVLYGMLPLFLGYFMLQDDVSWQLVALGIAWGLARGSLSILKDFKDMVGDKKLHKQTFLLRYGARVTITISHIMAVAGLAGMATMMIVYSMSQAMSLYWVVLVVPIVGIVRVRMTLTPQPAQANQVFHTLALWQLAYDGGIVLCLMLS